VYRSINGSPFALLTILKDRGKIDSYTDNTVQNCETVCYYILVKSKYCDPRLTGLMYSLSPKKCAIPLNDTPPIAPTVVISSCSTQEGLKDNVLLWNSLSDKTCNNLKGYNIYYAPYENQELTFLAFVTDTTYTHGPVDSSLAGCYQVAALNYVDIEGERSAKNCVDNCIYYKLPNLITRNTDGFNDVFKAFPIPKGVRSVRLNIYNQWGGQVFGFDGNPFVEWDATNSTGKEVSEGVYYYEAEVSYYRRLNPEDEKEVLKGWIHVLGTRN
jgi:hypothetical protein